MAKQAKTEAEKIAAIMKRDRVGEETARAILKREQMIDESRAKIRELKKRDDARKFKLFTTHFPALLTMSDEEIVTLAKAMKEQTDGRKKVQGKFANNPVHTEPKTTEPKPTPTPQPEARQQTPQEQEPVIVHAGKNNPRERLR